VPAPAHDRDVRGPTLLCHLRDISEWRGGRKYLWHSGQPFVSHPVNFQEKGPRSSARQAGSGPKPPSDHGEQGPRTPNLVTVRSRARLVQSSRRGHVALPIGPSHRGPCANTRLETGEWVSTQGPRWLAARLDDSHIRIGVEAAMAADGYDPAGMFNHVSP
jgi:hypothetical protein